MSTSELFTQNDDQSSEGTEPMFIGEGKKYQDILSADKAIAHKEEHISKIEQENADMRIQLEAAKKVDDIIESIQNRPLVPEDTHQTEEQNHQGVDMDALVAKAVEERLSLAEQERNATTNSKQVVSELEKRYGAKAKEVYMSKSQELGVDLDDLSRKSPAAVLAFFQDQAPRGSSNMSSSINTASLRSGSPEHGTYQYWEDQQKAGKVSREEKFKQQHISLAKLGATAFYGK